MSEKRGHYTQHGLHLNKIGKEWIAKKTANFINNLFANQKPVLIPMKWEEIESEKIQQSTGLREKCGIRGKGMK